MNQELRKYTQTFKESCAFYLAQLFKGFSFTFCHAVGPRKPVRHHQISKIRPMTHYFTLKNTKRSYSCGISIRRNDHI